MREDDGREAAEGRSSDAETRAANDDGADRDASDGRQPGQRAARVDAGRDDIGDERWKSATQATQATQARGLQTLANACLQARTTTSTWSWSWKATSQ